MSLMDLIFLDGDISDGHDNTNPNEISQGKPQNFHMSNPCRLSVQQREWIRKAQGNILAEIVNIVYSK